jgi:hypothetical protein
MHGDNGEAGAAGQPPPGAFPKGFMEGFEAFTGVVPAKAGSVQ